MPRPDVHSALLLLLVTALSLPWQALPVIAVASVLVGLAVLLSAGTRVAAWQAVRRMRWLLVSLLVLALFFTPGEPVIPQIAAVSPSWNGLMLMLERGLLLLTLALMATAFLVHYTAMEIVSAISRLLVFIPERAARRLALRIYLVLDEFPRMEERVRLARSGTVAGQAGNEANFMSAAAALIAGIERGGTDPETKQQTGETVLPDEQVSTPGFRVLLMPLFLLGLFMFAAMSIS